MREGDWAGVLYIWWRCWLMDFYIVDVWCPEYIMFMLYNLTLSSPSIVLVKNQELSSCLLLSLVWTVIVNNDHHLHLKWLVNYNWKVAVIGTVRLIYSFVPTTTALPFVLNKRCLGGVEVTFDHGRINELTTSTMYGVQWWIFNVH